MEEKRELLIEQVRYLLAGEKRVEEKRMFGAHCWMWYGYLLCGVARSGELLVRVGKAGQEKALRERGVRRMGSGGRKMSGFVLVEMKNLGDGEILAEWMQRAMEFVNTLPQR